MPWALLHQPLFGITPSYRAMPLSGLLGFAIGSWVAACIFAWLLHVGRCSLLVVVVFHAWLVVTDSPPGPSALPGAMGAAVTLVGLVLLRRLLRSSDDVREPPSASPAGSVGG